MEFYIVIFCILLFLSGFFASTELAILTIPIHRVETLVREGRFGARTLRFLKQNSDKFLITGLIGNDLVNTLLAALATQLSINLAQSLGIAQSTAVGLATGAITFLILMFGEIIPKSFAVKNTTFLALKTAHIYKYLLFILYPIVVSLEFVVKLITGKSKLHKITDEELETFIDMGRNSGTLEEEEHEKLKNILDFGDTKVEEVMIPRIDMGALSDKITVDEAFNFYLASTYSRIPVYTGNIDKIDYFITIRDIIKAREKGLNTTKLKDLESIRPVIKVPLNQPIDSVLKIFQKSYKHLAIVMDEYGGVAGLVTLEDIIEEIFGEIRDENDKGEEDKIKKLGENKFLINPNIIIDDILDEFDLRFSDIGIDKKEFSGETVSYLITHKLERFPKPEEVITYPIINHARDKEHLIKKEFLEIRVKGIDDGRIENIEITKI